MSRIGLNAMRTLSCLKHDHLAARYSGGAYKDSQDIEGYNVQTFEGDGFTELRIWSPRDQCLGILFEERKKVAILLWLKYYPGCRADGKMERGSGTRKMLEFGLRKATERGYTHIELSDTSKIDCGEEKVFLAPMYFLQNGVTWYEKYFGFQIDAAHKQAYETMKKLRKERLDITELKKQPCEFFTHDVVRAILRQIDGDLSVLTMSSWVKEL